MERTGVHPQRHLHVAATCKGDQLTRYDPGGRDGARETCKGLMHLSRKKAKATKAAGGRAGGRGKRTGDRARAREHAVAAKQVQERAGGKKNGRTRGDAGGQPGHDLGTRTARRRRSLRQQRFGKIKVADRRSKQGDNHVGDKRGTRSRKIVGCAARPVPPKTSYRPSQADGTVCQRYDRARGEVGSHPGLTLGRPALRFRSGIGAWVCPARSALRRVSARNGDDDLLSKSPHSIKGKTSIFRRLRAI